MARLAQMGEPLMSMMPGGGGSALGVDGLTSVSSNARGLACAPAQVSDICWESHVCAATHNLTRSFVNDG
jgi:hypothetical protein